MLVTLSILASLLGGLAKAPWWFWLAGAGALTLLAATDPGRPRTSYADVRGFASVPLLLGDLKAFTTACLMSATAFGAGTALSWALPV